MKTQQSIVYTSTINLGINLTKILKNKPNKSYATLSKDITEKLDPEKLSLADEELLSRWSSPACSRDSVDTTPASWWVGQAA